MNVPENECRDRHVPKEIKLLKRWQGGQVVLWSYSVGHKMMTLCVSCPGKTGSLLVCCGDTHSYRGPIEWNDSKLQLEELAVKSYGEPLYRLSDSSVDFEMIGPVFYVDVRPDIDREIYEGASG